MKNLENGKQNLDYIITYGTGGKLLREEEPKKGFKTLDEVRCDLENLLLIRESLLEIFKTDVLKKITKHGEKNDLKFPQGGIITMENLNLKLIIDGKSVNCLLSDSKIESMDTSDIKIEERINKILPFVKSLLLLYKDDETRNILANDIYNDLYVDIDNQINNLIINNNGIILSDLSLEKLKLTNLEKVELIKYYYDNLKKILEKILILDDKILDNYRTDLSKRKVLSLYKRGIKK